MLKKLLSIIEGKSIQICAHWDADGVCSAAMIYHLAKNHADFVFTTTKGNPFLIEEHDIIDDVDIVICVDIKPSPDLLALDKYIVYIDHHPNEDANLFNMPIHDINAQSTSMLIYEKLLKQKRDPYLIFLALVGYFADRGDRYTIPQSILKEAKGLIPDFLTIRESPARTFLDIERYVSPLNAGKRMFWSGDIPLELLKNIDDPEYLTDNKHPLAKQLQQYRKELKQSYDTELNIMKADEIDYAIIDNELNIQGVLATKNLKAKPLLILNTHKNPIYGSLRVPQYLDFDAGEFLSQFNDIIPTFHGGGYDKQAAMTIKKENIKEFIEEIKK